MEDKSYSSSHQTETLIYSSVNQGRMRVRLPLGAAAVLGALCALALLFNSEVLVARSRTRAHPPLRPSWKELAQAQPYVYAYHAGRIPFPMLALGARLDGCPGGPDAQPHVTVIHGGRLGNLVLEYAAVWAMARTHQLPAFVHDKMLRRLKEVFDGLTLPGARAALGTDAACAALVAQPGALEADWDKRPPWGKRSPVDLRRVPLNETVRQARQEHALIVLDNSSLLPEAVVPVASELRKEFTFRPLLRKFAQTELRRLRTKYFPNFDGEVVFGAVHARRTDYHGHLRGLYNVNQPAGADYYVAAAAWLRRGLRPDQRLLLVVASDDARWSQRELVPALEAAGEAESEGGGWAAAWAGSGDTLRPDRDLALLSACNHTIFSYGTFGLTAALAAGGRAVVYQLAHEPLHPTLLTPAEQFARHMPGWVALR